MRFGEEKRARYFIIHVANLASFGSCLYDLSCLYNTIIEDIGFYIKKLRRERSYLDGEWLGMGIKKNKHNSWYIKNPPPPL